jgi:hypothetical protein
MRGHGGLCSVAACSTRDRPMHSFTTSRSAIEPTTSVKGVRRTSTPTTCACWARSVRTSASSRWLALPRIASSAPAGEMKKTERVRYVHEAGSYRVAPGTAVS